MPELMPECEQFTGRKRQICRGETELAIDGPHGVNAYRAAWGLPPLPSLSAQPATPSVPSPVPPSLSPPPSALSQPSLIIRGWNFATALARWTLAGMPRRSQTEIDERLAICQACEFLKNQHCVKCGCACHDQNRLINKLALATEQCPLGKWPAASISTTDQTISTTDQTDSTKNSSIPA